MLSLDLAPAGVQRFALWRATAPALMPTVAFFLGISWAKWAEIPVGLAALGLLATMGGLRAAPSRIAIFVFLGLLLGVNRGEGQDLHPVGPADVVARVVGHPEGEGDSLRVLLRTEVIRKGHQVLPLERDLWLQLSSDSAGQAFAAAWGSRIRCRGILRYDRGPQNIGPHWPPTWRLSVKSGQLIEELSPAPWLGRLATSMRRSAEEKIAAWPGESGPGGLVRALWLGDRSRLPKSWSRSLTALGMVHALSVSGFHVSLVALMMLVATAMLPSKYRWLRLTAAVLVVVAFTMIVGPKPAALRAGWMGILAIAALLLNRPPISLNLLAISATLLVAVDPALLGDIGFRLSLAATFGLVAIGPMLAARWQALTWFPPFLRVAFGSSLGAEIAAGPWIWPLTGVLHPLSSIVNLILGPWMAFLLLCSGLWIALPAMLGRYLVPILEWITRPLEALGTFTASPWLVLPLGLGSVGAWVPPLLVLLLALGGNKSRWLVLVAALMAMLGGPPLPAEPELVMIDVGQGDALVLRSGTRAIMVDGGGWRRGDIASKVVLPALAKLGIRQLDAVVASHADRDHCEGLIDLASYWAAAELWLPDGEDRGSSCFAELERLMGSARWLKKGSQIAWRDWHIEVLWPPGVESGGLSENDRSLVLRAEANGRSILLTGDIEAAAERALVASHLEPVDILKVAHHGSKSSSGAAFLDSVAPKVALISVGSGNPFGHPNSGVIDRLRFHVGPQLYRADVHGMVRISPRESQGLKISFQGVDFARR